MTAANGQVIPEEEWYRRVTATEISPRFVTETPDSTHRYWHFFCQAGKRYEHKTITGVEPVKSEGVFEGQDNGVTFASRRTVNGFVSHFLFEVP